MADDNGDLPRAFNTVKVLWGIGGIAVSIAAALVTTTLYINDLLSAIKRLDKQVAAINQVLSFDRKYESKAATFNGNADDPLCPPGFVMRGVRITYQDITSSPHGSIECVNLRPAGIP
jgi:hypothetical protein